MDAPPRSSEQLPDTSVEIYSGKCRRVVDGDSLYLDGVEKQIRLWGVDAPERDEDGYTAARKKLTHMALGKQLRCRLKDVDKYGRIVARCYREDDNTELNLQQIESRVAREYCRFTANFYGYCR